MQQEIKSNEKKPYEAPKLANLGSVEAMTQLSKGHGNGSCVTIRTAG